MTLVGASPECSSPKFKAGRGEVSPALSASSSGVVEGNEATSLGLVRSR